MGSSFCLYGGPLQKEHLFGCTYMYNYLALSTRPTLRTRSVNKCTSRSKDGDIEVPLHKDGRFINARLALKTVGL